MATGAQDMESISKDKLYSTFQESSTGWHVELYQPSRFKNSFHFGTFSQHLGIIKVNHFLFKKLKKNSLWNNHKDNNWLIRKKENLNGKKKEEPDKFLILKIITRKKPDINSWQVGKRKLMTWKELKSVRMKFWEIYFFITNSTNSPKSMSFQERQHSLIHNNSKDWNNN